jgi:hypothetical protein
MICSPDVSKSQNEDKPNGFTSGHLSTTMHKKLKESHITTPNSSNKMPTKTTKSQQVSQKHSPQMEKETPDDKLKNSPQLSSHSHRNTPELCERPKQKKTPKSTVASRLEERRNKKRRKEELNNISTETKTEYNKPKSETDNQNNEEKAVDGSPPSCKDNEID